MSEGLEAPGDTVLSHTRQRVILDVDTGVDDAEAIMLAVAQPHIEVVAITCVSGNIDVQQVYAWQIILTQSKQKPQSIHLSNWGRAILP